MAAYTFRRIAMSLLITLLLLSYPAESSVANESPYYTAGVVEFRPTIAGMSSSDLVAEHLKAYIEMVESPEAKDCDIIVFPEGTLNNPLQLSYVPSGEENIRPCDDGSQKYASFLMQLSCAAAKTQKYLVINLTEKEDCPASELDQRPCATSGLNIYNTNVVFDRQGNVISRYRKVNIYAEQKNTTLHPEFGIFETDFGVQFGHFICFDILFYTPAQELVNKYGITDFIFPTLFYSELPFLTAVQLQHAWSWGNNINLLAAGASLPEVGATGTGIFNGRQGQLTSAMITSKEGERKLYKAKVPKNAETIEFPKVKPLASAENHLKLLKDPQIENFNSALLNISENSQEFQNRLCHNELCCNFDIVAELMPTNASFYQYRVGAFDGRRTYEKEQWSNIKICALYSCLTDEISSCGNITQWKGSTGVLFKRISISASFRKTTKSLIMPTSLDENLYPLEKDEVNWSIMDEGDQRYDVKHELQKERDNLLTFGIYANYYDTSAATLAQCMMAYELTALLVLFVAIRICF